MKRLAPALEPTWSQARERFLALQVRERWLLGVGVGALLLTVLYLGIWEPLVKTRQQNLEALQAARNVAVRLEAAAIQVRQARGRQPQVSAGQNQSLMAAVDQASQRSGLGKSPSRIQPEGDTEVRVWFEDVSFDALVGWLAELQSSYGVQVQTFDVDPQPSPGRVDVRLSLVRAP